MYVYIDDTFNYQEATTLYRLNKDTYEVLEEVDVYNRYHELDMIPKDSIFANLGEYDHNSMELELLPKVFEGI